MSGCRIGHYGFSITGKGHVARGIPCQDAHRIVRADGGVWVAAVADGVGSASRAREGSLIAAKEAAEFCARYLPVSCADGVGFAGAAGETGTAPGANETGAARGADVASGAGDTDAARGAGATPAAPAHRTTPAAPAALATSPLCERNLPAVFSMIRTAMNWALSQIERAAAKAGEDVRAYDTTLTLVLYDGHRAVFGHAGDGGAFGLPREGDVLEMTSPQKGPDGETVIPLQAGWRSWQIGACQEDLASVLLVTDGMRAAVAPYLLQLAGGTSGAVGAAGAADVAGAAGAPIDACAPAAVRTTATYLPLVLALADPAGFGEVDDDGRVDARSRCAFVRAESDGDTRGLPCDGDARDPLHGAEARGLPYDGDAVPSADSEPAVADGPHDRHDDTARGSLPAEMPAWCAPYGAQAMGTSRRLVKDVQDDKTVAVLANLDAASGAGEGLRGWSEPDWKVLRATWMRAAYPAMYRE